jgi:hypothetical protein
LTFQIQIKSIQMKKGPCHGERSEASAEDKPKAASRPLQQGLQGEIGISLRSR